jgi:hypothetical protein
MPPLQALAALHAFWAVAAAAAVDWLVRHARTSALRAWGSTAAVFGAGLLAAVVARGTLTWLQSGGGEPRYVVQRMLFVAATATDTPFGQLAAAGAFCWWVARRRERRAARGFDSVTPY